MPKISIILPVYNGARFIREAIESVRAQTFTDWELIVVDDGSIDETPGIVHEYEAADPRIRYIKNERNLGIQKTLNRGLRESTGEYIARIDDDDIWAVPEKLKEQETFLEKNPDHALVGTGTIEIDETGEELFKYFQPETDEAVRNTILFKNCFTHSSVMFKKSAVMELGGYDETRETLHVEDYDLWLRLGKQWNCANLPIYAVKFRLRPSSLSVKNKTEQFKKDRMLVEKYAAFYPHAKRAAWYAAFRQYAYSLYRFLPGKRFILGWYKRR